VLTSTSSAPATAAGRIAGRSCPDSLIPKFLGLGVQYFHSTVGRLLQQSTEAYLQKVRRAAADAGKYPPRAVADDEPGS
jgi:hypothetical protein